MNAAEYKAMQDRVELLSRLILDTDEAALADFIGDAERSNAIAPMLDPTAWIRGHDQLSMVTSHARAIARARRDIAQAAERAGAAAAGR